MLPPEGLLTGDSLNEPDDGGRNFRAKFECSRGTGTHQTGLRVGGPVSENPVSRDLAATEALVEVGSRDGYGLAYVIAGDLAARPYSQRLSFLRRDSMQ
jgi:hypothetical protein